LVAKSTAFFLSGEILEQFDFWSALLWFMTGVMSYRIIATVLSYAHMASFLERVRLEAITFLAVVVEDVAYMRMLKYKTMLESGMSTEEVKKVKEVDDHTFNMWKAAVIGQLRSAWPKQFNKILKIRDWRDVSNILTQINNAKIKKMED